MHGQGIYSWPDGRKYDGNYDMDKKHGYGVYYWQDGRKYEGQWSGGRQHGEGRYTSSDGKIRRGLWRDGKRVRWLDEPSGSGQKEFSPIQEDRLE